MRALQPNRWPFRGKDEGQIMKDEMKATLAAASI
jgi:hypothetical protein